VIVSYLDASAWVKRYVRESGTDWIENLFDRQPQFACASLGFIEVLATLSRKRRAGEITESQYSVAVEQLEQDQNSPAAWGRIKPRSRG
jgi:uncharacterized protein